jgi:hypothetical protein
MSTPAGRQCAPLAVCWRLRFERGPGAGSRRFGASGTVLAGGPPPGVHVSYGGDWNARCCWPWTLTGWRHNLARPSAAPRGAGCAGRFGMRKAGRVGGDQLTDRDQRVREFFQRLSRTPSSPPGITRAVCAGAARVGIPTPGFRTRPTSGVATSTRCAPGTRRVLRGCGRAVPASVIKQPRRKSPEPGECALVAVSGPSPAPRHSGVMSVSFMRG